MKRLLTACLLVALARSVWAAPEQPLYSGKPIEYWVQQLKDDDALAREEAVLVLADAGPAAEAALPALKEMLKSPAPAVRVKAAVAVWKIGGEADAATHVLIDALKSGDRPARVAALDALVQMGAGAKEAAAAVEAALSDSDAAVRQRAAAALERAGAAGAAALAGRLRDKSPAVRHDVVVALGRMGAAARNALPELKAAVGDEDPSTRVIAAGAVLGLAPSDPEATAALIEIIKAANTDDWRLAGQFLLNLRPRSKAAEPGYVALLKDDEVNTRLRAAEALWELNGRAKEVLPVLIDALKSKDPSGRERSLALLARLGPEINGASADLVGIALDSQTPFSYGMGDVFSQLGPEAAPPLIEGLRSKNAAVGMNASNALACMGSDAAPALFKLLDDPDPQVRVRALNALGGIGPSAPGVVAALIGAAKDAKDPVVRRAAVAALNVVGPESKDAIPVLLEVLRDKNANLRIFALVSLQGMRLDPETAVPALDEVVQQSNGFLRVQALELRWRLDRKAGPAVDGLTKLLEDPPTHILALEALGRIAVRDKEAIPAVASRLHDKEPLARIRAVAALEGAGTLAKEAAPAAREALKNQDRETRIFAARVLARAGESAEAAVPVLTEGLSNSSLNQADVCARSLGLYGQDAASAAPALRDLLKSPIHPFRAAAAEALCRIDPAEKARAVQALLDCLTTPISDPNMLTTVLKLDPPNKRAREMLREGLEDPDPTVFQTACVALGMAGSAARDMAPLLERRLGEETGLPRMDTAAAYWKAGGDADKASAVFTECLKDPSSTMVRRVAAVRLGEMGGAAKAAAPALQDALRDRLAAVRFAAADALRAVDPDAADKAGVP